MKKLILSIIVFCALSLATNLFAQCTPDPNLKTTAILPEVIDSAMVGVPYSQVIQYFITKDTTVYVAQLGTTVNATIDTLWITDVVGLPNGFTYACHNADCKITGGSSGCAVLTGTATTGQGGIYPLLVLITIRATAMIGPLPISQMVSDTNGRYALVVKGATGNSEIAKDDEMVLYPNPVKNELQVYVPALNGNGKYVIKNIQGQLVAEGNMASNREVSHITIQEKTGIYFIEIRSENQIWTRKFVVE
ncbi:MAG: T9SS type A sorting domain-containing protein [Bacteroidia bacterium]|nr:T9SS type A sorting domain-containing protein [Bacteroidia bacterium]MCF8428120.1 T9SS type A sorting domain-containing protein [Bacteroidia bacterium]MCF8447728.1 T9SS type A sorting domain-containing protein [Bacteroidia bacterium]